MSPITEKMATRPTNAGSRSCIKKHVTKWIDKIKDYQNVSVDLTIRNTLLGAETILRNELYKLVYFEIINAKYSEYVKNVS